MNEKYNIDDAMKKIFEFKQRQSILNAIDSSEFKQEVNGYTAPL